VREPRPLGRAEVEFVIVGVLYRDLTDLAVIADESIDLVR
jgi:hypothetical protein